MSALLNTQHRILLLSPVEQKNISELRAPLINQTPSILPHHHSCPPAYGVQQVPSLIWWSVILLPTRFVFPMNLAMLSNSWPADPWTPKGTSFGRETKRLSSKHISVKLPAALYQQYNLTQHKDDEVFFGDRRWNNHGGSYTGWWWASVQLPLGAVLQEPAMN